MNDLHNDSFPETLQKHHVPLSDSIVQVATGCWQGQKVLSFGEETGLPRLPGDCIGVLYLGSSERDGLAS